MYSMRMYGSVHTQLYVLSIGSSMQHGEQLTWHPVRVAVLLVVVLLEGIGAVCLVGLTTDLLQQLWEEEGGPGR